MLIWFVYPPETDLITVTDSLFMRVYHYLIECLLRYFIHIVIQIRMSFPKGSSHVDLISLEPQYIFVG